MPEQPCKLVFFGTPAFAVASARALMAANLRPAAVVTVPDKPAGRGAKLRASAVKEWALGVGIPILQPDDLRSPAFLAALRELNADLFIVVAFRILPPEVFTMPRLGTINVHASLLPKYRGAAPINWAIIHGESETGVTTFLIDEKMDTGHILLQEVVPIDKAETFGELYQRLEAIGAALLVRTVDDLVHGNIQPQPQRGEATRAPKITPAHCRIDWRKPADEIRNLVRGLNPQPGAFTTFGGRRVKLFRCREVEMATGKPGEVIVCDRLDGRLIVQCGTHALQIEECQLEGKKRMPIADFLRGFNIEAGDEFVVN